MPKKPNTALRIAIPLLAAAVAVGIGIATAVNSSRQPRLGSAAQRDATSTQAPSQAPTLAAAQTPAADSTPAADQAPGANTPQPTQTPTQPAASAPGSAEPGNTEPGNTLPALRLRPFADLPEPLPVGSLDPGAGASGRIEFSARGAGIASLRLAEHFETTEKLEHVTLQKVYTTTTQGPDGQPQPLYAVPFAMLAVTVQDATSPGQPSPGQPSPGQPGPSRSGAAQTLNAAVPGLWRPIGEQPGSFEAIVEDSTGREHLRLTRRFLFTQGRHDFTIEQTVENLTDRELVVTLTQAGPVDLPAPGSNYGGDKRRFRFGYLLSPQSQLGDMSVTADSQLTGHATALGKAQQRALPKPLWPTPQSLDRGDRLSWFALTDRYFAVAVHPEFDPAALASPEGLLLDSVASIDRLVLNPLAKPDRAVIATKLNGTPIRLTPGASSAQRMGVYAGPLLTGVIAADPVANALNLQGLVVYNFGGFCGETCTFGWLTHLLLAVLRGLHAITLDWGVSVILLVVVVRGVLHPITRWSQTKMLVFGTQMQALGPKQQKLRERFKDDPQKFQQEMAKLYKEEGVNPAGCLGFLPMFLQSPVWIALYATLYFAGEMRHEPGFYGLFQAVSAGSWRFLSDLASPDAALPLPEFMRFTPPLLGGIWGRVESINLLPILMGVVFYLHQKYLTPPSTATLTPEQEQMQKTMRIMFPLMMPLFMYPAPSGLTIYFITNSTLGILESRWIRRSAEAKGLTDPEKLKQLRTDRRSASAAKPGGFLQRLKEVAEQQQSLRAQQVGQPGRRKVQNTADPRGSNRSTSKPTPRPDSDRYKKRGK